MPSSGVMLAGFRERFLQRAEAAEVVLPDAALDRIEAYYVLLNHWNRKINLTALPLESLSDEAIDRVLVEPLVASNAVPAGLLDWFDLGSGGGSPALPIKIVRPAARLTLIETRSRKAAFLREAVRELSLSEVSVVDDRFENVAAGASGACDLVTVRAVRIDAALFDSSLRFLRPGGELLLFTTRNTRGQAAPRGFSLSRVMALIPGQESELVVLARN